jgi:hypothetical protein
VSYRGIQVQASISRHSVVWLSLLEYNWKTFKGLQFVTCKLLAMPDVETSQPPANGGGETIVDDGEEEDSKVRDTVL